MNNIVAAINSWIELENRFKELVARDVAAFIHGFSQTQYTLSTTPIRFTPIAPSDGKPRCIIHFLQTDYELALWESDSLCAEIVLSRVPSRCDGDHPGARRQLLCSWELDRMGNVSYTSDGAYTVINHLGKAVFGRICSHAGHRDSGHQVALPAAGMDAAAPDFVLIPDEDAHLPAPDATDMVTIPRADMERVQATLLAWWVSKRPPDWSEGEHVLHPAVNLHEAEDIALAQLIVEMVGHGER